MRTNEDLKYMLHNANLTYGSRFDDIAEDCNDMTTRDAQAFIRSKFDPTIGMNESDFVQFVIHRADMKLGCEPF